MSSATELYELSFLAPVPRDHLVLVATVHRDGAYGTFVLDQTAGVLYSDTVIWGPLGKRASAVNDPLATLAQYEWRPVRASTGRIVGAMISTKNMGDANHAETRLFVEPLPPAAPYR